MDINRVTGIATEMLDLATLVKAAQAVSGEIALDKLLKTLMEIIIENAGAEKGYLFLQDEDVLTIEAVGQLKHGKVSVLNSLSVDAKQHYSSAVVNYVVRTKQSLVLGESHKDSRFLSDPYIHQRKIKSIICTPIVRQRKLIGITYLENNLITGAFTPACEKFINTLLSQAAISIENSRLYQDMKREINERRQAESALRVIASGTASVTGEDFFKSLVQSLATSLEVKCVLVSECTSHDNRRVRTLAFMNEGKFIDNIEYDLEGTPCEGVIQGDLCYYPENVEKLYPVEKGFESYMGVPAIDLTGRVLGHLAIFDTTDMRQLPHAESILRIFATRVGVELHRMRTQEALQVSEEKYRLLVENQTDLIVKLNPQGHFQFVSPSYCELFARSDDDLQGSIFQEQIHSGDLDRVDRELERLFVEPHAVKFEHRTLTAYGERWLGWSLSAVLDSAGSVVEIVGLGRDITDRRKAEEQARQNLHTLAHAGRLQSMGEMGSTLAHELNQPLTAILSFSQASQRVLKSGEFDHNELVFALERIAVNAKRAGDIIRHIRGFVRKEEPLTEPSNINQLIHETMELVNNELLQHDTELVLDLQEPLPAVRTDRVQIQQVILNLVRNSMEAMQNNSTAECRITVSTWLNTDGAIEATITDTGPGLDAEVAGNIFTSFVTTKSEGMGIGLSICKSIVEAHGGELLTRPRFGGGAIFSFTLPLAGEEAKHEYRNESKYK